VGPCVRERERERGSGQGRWEGDEWRAGSGRGRATGGWLAYGWVAQHRRGPLLLYLHTRQTDRPA